ncbi:choice-of-anchor M domain-containing protein [Plantactinospora sp. CA-294935]|uniref:choice-of-anchor M domain-containing protein n=1 Tax=Plantactinospora sp. CA-294935 TaxID=3240012 RepID=UPI003D8CCB59
MARAAVRCGAAAAALLALIAPVTPAVAREPTPGLDQSIAPDQPLATDRAVLRAGHVDIGPRYVDDRWTLLVHDDAERPVWRSTDETVLHVSDAALQTVPDDPAYSFLDVEAGARVHVVPQTQQPDVVWIGWNTQDPRVMRDIDRGVTLTLLGVRGPGAMTVYLQSGNFAAPQVLWRSAEPKPQPLWVEVNTHTHANWVFTRPGVYLVAIQVSADLASGEQVSDTRLLRVAVGDATSTDEAFTASADIPSGPAVQPASDSDTAAPDRSGGGRSALIALLAGVAVLLVVALVWVQVRGGSARRRAERERAVRAAAAPTDGDPTSESRP